MVYACLILTLLFGLWGSAAMAAPVMVKTPDGPVKGVTSGNIHQFLGIPYAAPPEGPLRWRPPQHHAPWPKGLKAINVGKFGDPCPQIYSTDSTDTVSGKEDCLFLNVYTPKKSQQTAPVPVMVWIHGGCGCGEREAASEPLLSGGLFDPTPLVENGGVIVVTLNYRLGVLGRLAHPALDAEGHPNANYGLMDQQFALQWVQQNIAAFGGDPSRVTIFGESAGGISVYSNLASPTAKDLFQRAISQSGALSLFYKNNPILPLVTAEVAGTAFASRVGCLPHRARHPYWGRDPTAQCLRAKTAGEVVKAAAELVKVQPDFAFNFLHPIVDGTVLTQTLDSAFKSGLPYHPGVRVISGSNHDEWRTQVALDELTSGPLMAVDYQKAVEAFLGPATEQWVVNYLVETAYPLTNYPQPSAPLALGALGTDAAFACPARTAAQLLSDHGVQTYVYEFNDKDAPSTFPNPPSFPLGAAHFSEVQYLFNIPPGTAALSPAQRQLSKTMISYWTQFAKTGDPNGSGAPQWDPYGAGKIQSLVPPPTPVLDSMFDTDHKCSEIWSK